MYRPNPAALLDQVPAQIEANGDALLAADRKELRVLAAVRRPRAPRCLVSVLVSVLLLLMLLLLMLLLLLLLVSKCQLSSSQT